MATTKADTSQILQILAEIARLQAKLPDDASQVNQSGFMLQRYLDELTSYAESVCGGSRRSSLEISNDPELENNHGCQGEFNMPEEARHRREQEETQKPRNRQKLTALPELQHIVAYLSSHSDKLYLEGYLLKRLHRDTSKLAYKGVSRRIMG
jgi:hypothetical protein